MTWEERLQALQEQAGTSDAGDPQNASTPSTPNNAAASENFDDKLQRLEQSRVSRLEGLEKASKQAGRSDEEDPQKASTQEKEEEVEHEFKLEVMVKKEKVKAQRSAPAQKKEEEKKPLQELQEQAGKSDAADPQIATAPSTYRSEAKQSAGMSEEEEARRIVWAFAVSHRAAAADRVGRSTWKDMTWVQRLQAVQEQEGKSDEEHP
jgi:hypothetical protein